MSDRRAFLKFLAASPLFAGIPTMLEAFAQESTLASAEAALDVFDFEAAARKVVPPAHAYAVLIICRLSHPAASATAVVRPSAESATSNQRYSSASIYRLRSTI
jgi:hypothetical protein